MRITYFNYLFDIDSTSMAATVKARCLLGALRCRGHKIVIHWRNPHAKSNGPIYSWPLAALKKCFSPWFNFPMSFLRGIRDLCQELPLLKADPPDVILTRLEVGRFSAAIIAPLLGLPLVVEADAPVVYEQRYFLGRRLPPWFPERLEMFTLQRADAIFTTSKVMTQYYLGRGVDPDRISTIENGVDPDLFHPLPPNESARSELGLQGQTVVGFSGSLSVWHDVRGLLHTFDDILKRHDECVLLVAGSGGNAQTLLENWSRKAARRERFRWLQHVPHESMPKALAAMDVILVPAPPLPLPYFSPLKLFEAMAMGRVVVAARQGQVADIVRHGENGFLYDPGDPNGLVNMTLEALNRSDRDRLGLAARETMVSRYTWDRQAKKLEALLEDTLQRHRRR